MMLSRYLWGIFFFSPPIFQPCMCRYLREREARDDERDKMRDKYKIARPERAAGEEDSEDEDEGDSFGARKPQEKDAVGKAKDAAVEKLQDATNMVSGLFSGFRR